MFRVGFAILLKKKWSIILPLVIVFLFSAYFGIREFWRWYGINQEYQNINKDVSMVQDQTQELKKQLDNLSTPQFLEREARARLNLKKEGESVLVVVGEDNFPKEDFLKAETVSVFDNPESVWFNLKSWKNYFFPITK